MEEKKKSNYQPIKKTGITVISLLLFCYPFLMGMIGAPPGLVFRPTYLLLLFVLAILCLPSKVFKPGSWGEYLLNGVMIVGIIGTIWVATSWMDLMLTFDLSAIQIIVGICLLLAAMELTRRTPVRALNYVAIPAILYALFGNYLPGLFGHAGMDLERLVWSQLFTQDGLFGTPLAIGATYIGLFVFFSAFLEASGGGEKFMNFTMSLAGRFSGGPAKVAVIASGLMGMISGSAVTNVVTTGVITIPMMKRVGYKGSIAGGVEATASLGSQITPPIMGATAFLISEFTGISYFEIITVAIIPCMLYYLGVFMQVHLCSLKLNIGGIPAKSLPGIKKSTVEVLPFIVPIVILVYFLQQRYSPEYAISLAITSFFIICLINKNSRPLLLKNFIEGIRQGAASLLPLVGSLTIAGVIIGVLTMTGLGDRLSYLIEILSGGNFHLLVFFTALICMILGMGMVTIGAYVLVAVLTAPVMVDMGVPLLAAHLFIFYFAVVSAISPPVMVGVFAASSIADSHPMETAMHAIRFAIVGFIVPVLFVYDPQILLLDGFSFAGLLFIATAVVGIISLAMAFERYSFYNKLPVWKAVLFFITGILTMIPAVSLSITGTAVFIVLMVSEYLAAKKSDMKKSLTEGV